MKHFKVIVVLSVLALVLFAGCKKYPEDEENIHWKRVKKRLWQTWQMSKFEVDGVDSTVQIYNSDTTVTNHSFVVEFTRDENNGSFLGRWRTYAKFKYEFIEHKSKIQIQWNKTPPPNTVKGYTSKQNYDWEIIRLDKNDLWLKQELDGKTYVSKFTQIIN